eukprot:6190772-Pleurochrysis_carterae.AAC.3
MEARTQVRNCVLACALRPRDVANGSTSALATGSTNAPSNALTIFCGQGCVVPRRRLACCSLIPCLPAVRTVAHACPSFALGPAALCRPNSAGARRGRDAHFPEFRQRRIRRERVSRGGRLFVARGRFGALAAVLAAAVAYRERARHAGARDEGITRTPTRMSNGLLLVVQQLGTEPGHSMELGVGAELDGDSR